MADQNVDFQVTANTGQAEQAFDKLAKSQDKATTSTNNFRSAADRSRMVGMSFNRVIQDSPYFLSSFSMGVMSISNNLPIMAEQMAAAKAEGHGFNTVLKNMFSGMNGILTVTNLVIGGILAYTMSQRGAKEASDDWDLKSLIGKTDAFADSLAKVKKELSGLSDKRLGDTIGNLNKGITDLTDKMVKAGVAVSISGAGGGLLQLLLGRPENYSEALIKLDATLNAALDEVSKRITSPGSYNFIKKQLDKLYEDFYAGNTKLAPEIKRLEAQLDRIKDLLRPDAVLEEIEPYDYDKFAEMLLRSRGLDPKAVKAAIEEEKRIIQKEVDEYAKEMATRFAPDNLSRGSRYMDMSTNYQKDTSKAYKEALTEFAKLGSNLRMIFRDAGGSFLDSMLQAFDVVVRIYEVAQAIAALKAIMMGLGLFTGGATSAYATGVDATGSVILSGSMVSGGGATGGAPLQIIIPVSIGDKQVAMVVADGTKKAQRLRYLS